MKVALVYFWAQALILENVNVAGMLFVSIGRYLYVAALSGMDKYSLLNRLFPG